MTEESNEQQKSNRDLWKKQLEKFNGLAHMKQYQLNNGWRLYTDEEFSFWDNDPNYLMLDQELDTVLVFYFKEDTIKVKKSNWDIEFTFNMKKQLIKVSRKSFEE